MPTFSFRAVDAEGLSASGQLDATSRADALALLHERGLVPVQLAQNQALSRVGAMTKIRERLARRGYGDALSGAELISTTRSLAALLRAGLTIDRALAISAAIEVQSRPRRFLESLAVSVRSGSTFVQALEATHAKFPRYYLSMVQAGEVGGSLAPTLGRLADLLQKQRQVRDRVQSALIYPAVLASVVLGTLVIMVAFVLPRFKTLFAESEAPLPWSTRVVLALGDFVSQYGWALLLLVVAGAAGAVAYRRSASGRTRIDHWLLHTRWTMRLPAMLDTARMLRTLATLLQNGVTLPASLRIAGGSLTNSILRHALDQVCDRVKSGGQFAAALLNVSVFPNEAIQLARVGEETGRLDDMLLEAAAILESDSERTLERLLNLLAPALTILMGGMVAALIGSVLIGLLSINDLAF